MTTSSTQTIYRDLLYGGKLRQTGDLFLPAPPVLRRPVLLIHGGGWNALSKESLEPFARFLQERGHPVFNINYHLLDMAPWPVCLDDCIKAIEFLRSGELERRGLAKVTTLSVMGASAGGHLAMMAGTHFARSTVATIVSVSGPVYVDRRFGSCHESLFSPDFLKLFFGRQTVTEEEVEAASPVTYLSATSPNLICFHSRHDALVPKINSEVAVDAWRAAGAQAKLHLFDGPGTLHGLWDSDDMATRQIIPILRKIMVEHLEPL